MATPPRNSPAELPRRNTAKGKFWIGNSQPIRLAESSQLRVCGSCVSSNEGGVITNLKSPGGETRSLLYWANRVANWTSMVKVSQPGRAAPATNDLKGRIVAFMSGASTEITPSEENRLPALKTVLPAGTAVFVAHTPNASFDQVIHAALAVRRAGFLATPHIAVRRVPNSQMLRAGLAQLRAGGVEDILLIAGDAPRPMGEFSGTLDVLESRILEESGIARIGIAGHPEGHSAVASALLWEALEAKQAIAGPAGLGLYIFGAFGRE